MPGDDALFQEAVTAIRQGDRRRGRDLLTRLLKRSPENPEYWLWMSAVVDSARERSYCLKEVLKFDPNNAAARRGLILLGALPPDPSLAVPARLQTRNWMAQIQLDPALIAPPLRATKQQIAVLVGAVLVLAALVFIGIFSARRVQLAQYRWAYVTPTPGPSPTFLPSPSPVVRTNTPVYEGPQPLWMLLQATYTPTALYINTPHPQNEDFRLAMKNYQKGDWKTMLVSLGFVAKAEPDSPDVQYYIGEAYRGLDQLDKANKAYNQALALNPQFAPAYVGLARVQLSLSKPDPDAALRNLALAIEADPDLADAYVVRIQIELAQPDGEAALADVDTLGELLPDSFLFYFYRAQANLLTGSPEDALSDARRSSEIDITSLPAYRLVGEAALAAGVPGEGFEALKTYTLYETGDSQALTWFGLASRARGEADLALEAFSDALAADPDNGAAYLERGRLYLDQLQAPEAIQDLSAAIQIQPTDFATRLALGRAYLLDEQFGPAHQQFSLADAYDETPVEKAEVYYLRGQSLEGLGQAGAAIKDYKALLALAKEDVPVEWLDFANRRLQELQPAAVNAEDSTATARPPLATATP